MTLKAHDLKPVLHAVGWLATHHERYRLCVTHNIGIESDESYGQAVINCLEIIERFANAAGLDVITHLAENAKAAAVEKGKYSSLSLDHPIVLRYISTTAELLEALYKSGYLKRAWVAQPSYTESSPFGEEVGSRFPEVAYDIEEAAKCLTFERATASVFHLMRVVEYAVQQLGKKLKVSVSVREATWYQIVIQISKRVDELPARTPRQREIKECYGATAAHLNMIRIATRNNVMHPKKSYSLPEAFDVFERTRTLMQDMVKVFQ